MRSLTKGLCASGWQSCAMFMRMHYDAWLSGFVSLGAAGIDEVRWLKPVRPGHVLQGRSVCTAKRIMRSRPEVGICQMQHEMLNQDGEVLLTMQLSQFIAVRTPSAGQPETRT